MRFKVGKNCDVDPAANQIMIKNGSNGQIMRLEPRIMLVLVLLAEHPGQVLTREFLIETVWENKFVGEEGLTQAISKLRKVFGDEARNPKVIETIPKYGYRIIADIEANSDISMEVFNGLRKANKALNISPFTITAFVFLIVLFLIHHF